jgi:type I restriction enzyme S subunit
MTSDTRPSGSPLGWPCVRLGDLSRREDAFADGPFGSNLKTEHYSAEGVRVIRLQNIGSGFFLDADKAFVPVEHYARLKRHGAEPDDVVVAALGDGARPAGRACVVPPGIGPAMVKADCFRIRLPRTVLLPDFLAGYLNSPQALTRVAELLRGATRPRVTLEILKRLEILLPSVPEQTQIILALNRATQTVERTRAAAEARLEAVLAMEDAFLRSAFGTSAAQHWPRRQLANCTEIVGEFRRRLIARQTRPVSDGAERSARIA